MIKVHVSASLFHAALTSALHCAPKKDVRYYLNGVNLRFNANSVEVTATDGHTLFNVKVPIWSDSDIPDDLQGTSIILDRGVVDKWVKCFKELAKSDHAIVTLTVTGDKAKKLSIVAPYIPDFVLGEDHLIDGTFPDFDRVIPAESREADPEIGFTLAYLWKAEKALKLFARAIKMQSGDARAPVRFVATSSRWTDPRDEAPVTALYVLMPVRP